MDPTIKKLAIKKAAQSSCRHKVSALGFSHKGDLIYIGSNRPRFHRPGASLHAEMLCMLRAGPGLKTIIICRVGKGGDVKPIDPCKTCKEKARELGIKIISVEEA